MQSVVWASEKYVKIGFHTYFYHYWLWSPVLEWRLFLSSIDKTEAVLLKILPMLKFALIFKKGRLLISKIEWKWIYFFWIRIFFSAKRKLNWNLTTISVLLIEAKICCNLKSNAADCYKQSLFLGSTKNGLFCPVLRH